MRKSDVTILKNEYNSIISRYLDSKENTLKDYINNLPTKIRVRLQQIDKMLPKVKQHKI